MFFIPSNIVTFSVDGGVLLGMSRVVIFFNVFYFLISSSIILLESQNVAEPKVHSVLISHPTYVNFNLSQKLSIDTKTLHTHST